MTGADSPAVNEKALARRVKDHILGSAHEFFAVVHPGFEAVALEELRDLGIPSPCLQGTGGIGFRARLDDAWRVNLGAGSVSRVLLRLARFKATGFAELRDRLAALPWELHLADRAPLRFTVDSRGSRLWHEGRIEEEAGTAIARRLAAFGRSVGPGGGGEAPPAQHVFIHFAENGCQVSLDTSGELLYKRGQGKFTEGAPLRETLACGILRAAALDRYRVLVDPFCGSGTFGLEAAAIFTGRPVNLDRSFAFMGWPSFRPARFQHLREELARALKERAPAGRRRIYCSDLDARSVETARRNLEHAGAAAIAEVDQADFLRLHPPAGDPAEVLLAMNPPYGARQEPDGGIAELYRRIGAKVRRDFRGCGYAVIVPGLELEKVLGLPHDRKILFHNGGIPVALLIKNSKAHNT